MGGRGVDKNKRPWGGNEPRRQMPQKGGTYWLTRAGGATKPERLMGQGGNPPFFTHLPGITGSGLVGQLMGVY